MVYSLEHKKQVNTNSVFISEKRGAGGGMCFFWSFLKS